MDINALKKEGKCFNCGKKGHMACECPEKKKEQKPLFNRKMGRDLDTTNPDKTEQFETYEAQIAQMQDTIELLQKQLSTGKKNEDF